jgi:4'-phosphopantetheinyl transferase
MNVYWVQQAEIDVPVDNDWLSRREKLRLETFIFPKRRLDWRLGRWTAKCAFAACQQLPLRPDIFAGIEIIAAPSGAPEVFVAGKLEPVTLSLSHRSGVALCAVTLSPTRLGCDLELVEPHMEGFVADYFTVEEQARVAHTRAGERTRFVTLLWSGKESALKALHEGLRLDTRYVSVYAKGTDGTEGTDGWNRLDVTCGNGHSFSGWWSEAGDLIRTLVADPSPALPISLHNSVLGRGDTREYA